MKATLKLEIECGEKTCAKEPGKFCAYCITSPFGKDKCFLFGRIFDNEGWLLRHPNCLKRAVKKALQTVEWEMVKAEENEENNTNNVSS